LPTMAKRISKERTGGELKVFEAIATNQPEIIRLPLFDIDPPRFLKFD
jgi:hypothetical protein